MTLWLQGGQQKPWLDFRISDLLEEAGAKIVKIVCLVELEALNGKEAVKDYDYEGIVKY